MQTNDDRSRPDEAMAWIVEDGIALAASDRRPEAVEYLAARNVPDAVIARVLMEPGRRRAPPQAH